MLLHYFCRSVLPLIFLPLHVAAHISATSLCAGTILLFTSVTKDMPQQSEWEAQKWVSNEEPPFEDKRSSSYFVNFP
jgi:hypothetical protein